MLKYYPIYFLAISVVLLNACGSYVKIDGKKIYLTDKKTAKLYKNPRKHFSGMQYIGGGSFTKGYVDKITASKNDTTLLVGITQEKDSVADFYISDHEVTNAEYREFVFWVRDSIASYLFGEPFITIGKNDRLVIWYDYFPPNYEHPEVKGYLKDFIYVQSPSGLIIDSRKFVYSYFANGDSIKTSVYPDTAIFRKEFPYMKDDYMAKNYFTDEKYNDYPVIGVSWQQANAYCHWRTVQYNKVNKKQPVEFRLPTEAEWEFAALGKSSKKVYYDEHRLFPWDGIDTRNEKGSYRANYGNSIDQNNLYVKYYVNDGYFLPGPVKTFKPNEFKLYNMAGNVVEWTSDKPSKYLVNEQNAIAFEKNPDSRIVKGGSWANGSAYLFCGGKEIFSEYKSSSRIGFRVVMVE